MDCPGGHDKEVPAPAAGDASTLVLMDCPGGRQNAARRARSCGSFNPCFNGLSRRTPRGADIKAPPHSLQPLF